MYVCMLRAAFSVFCNRDREKEERALEKENHEEKWQNEFIAAPRGRWPPRSTRGKARRRHLRTLSSMRKARTLTAGMPWGRDLPEHHAPCAKSPAFRGGTAPRAGGTPGRHPRVPWPWTHGALPIEHLHRRDGGREERRGTLEVAGSPVNFL